MRRIQAPGIEINEIDKSAYNASYDESLVDTTSLICGFADKGQDYEATYINTMLQFSDMYGTPTNEAEKYFYYGAKEILDNRGQLICVKLPYDNNTLDKLAYTTYALADKIVELSSSFSIVNQQLPLISHPIQNQTVENNSFFRVMNMDMLNKGGFTDIDAHYKGRQLQYASDLIQYVFNAANVPSYIWSTYSKYFKQSMIGYWNFITFLSYPLSSGTYVENVIADLSAKSAARANNSIDVDSWQDFYDLTIILEKIYNTYKDSNAEYSTLFLKAAKDFICTKQLTEIKEYYYNLSSMITPILNDIKNTFDTDTQLEQQDSESQHRWKIYFSNLSNFVVEDNDIFDNSYSDIMNVDSAITSMLDVISLKAAKRDDNGDLIDTRNTGLMSLEEFDNLKTTKIKVKPNTFKIVEIGRTNYLPNNDNTLECLGILPVVTTATNALYYQYMIKNKFSAKTYNALSEIQTVHTQLSNSVETYQDLTKEEYYDFNSNEYLFENILSNDVERQSYCDYAVKNFPTLNYTASKHIDKNYLKQIGIVVFKMQKNTSLNKIQLIPVESFVGSLDYHGKDLNNNASNFIDNLVNDNSKYINVFSNIDTSENTTFGKASILNIHDQVATSLGFYKVDREKTISINNSIKSPLRKIFDNLKNIDTVNIDLVIDAGISTIAQFISLMAVRNEFGQNVVAEYYDVNAKRYVDFNIMNNSAVKEWKIILEMYDNFCKNVRKDCMFIADALRSTCVVANQPNLRKTTHNNQFKKEILDKLDYQIGINTSYGAGYCDWFYVYDQFSKTYFWCPPSIKAAGKYIYTDIYYNYWDAPAGLNRGVVDNVFGIAFNPTNDEAGQIYNRSWNYAMQYPLYGYVLEGQKTFQVNKTAFDRVNVRRLFLKMEKLVYRIAKRFCYEGNTPYMRQRFVDTIRPIFEEAIQGSGISEYVIICDERNNKTINIENHELHCTIAVRPVKTIEFVVLNFIAMPQSGSFTEETILNMTPYYS